MPTLRTLIFLLLALMLPVTKAAVQPQTFNSPYSQADLDRMLAPVALYPDSVLAQMLIAATYPLEVMEAAHWSREHRGLEGDAAVAAVENRDWDPGVKSMVAFPDVIDRMDEHINWTTHLGDAFLQQEEQVMATIQSLREHALDEGHLKSSETIRVYREPEIIVIEPVRPQVVYVPYYDSRIVYGHWWHPHHPPYYWSRPHSYHSTSVFYWGSGISFSFGFYYSNIDWHHRHVVVHKHYRDYTYYRRHRPHDYRPGKPFYKHANYKENYRHWRPEHRRQGYVDKRHIDNKRQQLGGRHDRQRFDRGPDRRAAGQHKNRDHRGDRRATRAADIRHQLRSPRHDADKQRNRVERGSARFSNGDRRGSRQQQPERPRMERARLLNNERDRSAVQRFRANLERHQDWSSDGRARRQQEGQANRSAISQRERRSNNDRRFDNDRARQLRRSLANNRPASSRSNERSLQNRREDGRANIWNNRERPSFDRRSATNQRQFRDSQIRRDIQVRRNDNHTRRDIEHRPRQSLGNAGVNRQQASGRGMEQRHAEGRGQAKSARHSADRRRDSGSGRHGMGHGGRGRDASVAASNGHRR